MSWATAFGMITYGVYRILFRINTTRTGTGRIISVILIGFAVLLSDHRGADADRIRHGSVGFWFRP